MSRLRHLALGVWEFVVGDDWITAAGVVVALGVTAIIAAAGAPAWWVMPVAAIGLLALSVGRAARWAPPPAGLTMGALLALEARFEQQRPGPPRTAGLGLAHRGHARGARSRSWCRRTLGPLRLMTDLHASPSPHK
jgi:hypothetical protein